MYSSGFPQYVPETSLDNEPLNYNLFDTQKMPGLRIPPYRPTQMATEEFVNRWQDIQGDSPSLGQGARMSQDVHFENSLQKSGNSRPQDRTPSVGSGDNITLGELRLVKNKYDQIDLQMKELTEGLRQLAVQSARVDNLAERVRHLESLPVQVESLRESNKRMERKLHECCKEMDNEVKRINRVADTYEYIDRKFHGLLCRLSRRRSADDCRVLEVGDEA
ncbi:hypothetical protein EYZ11_005996 [Aspergillus tanneri]|uniref:Uncharacterized protein n=1 Tax=Aspergillus tanneri TaxID=1220188 RepID=A0A4V3UPB7_9EURO|nr:uncharacterized protein ATNIH1004_011301 [Aspergillus tanneri]KAA8642357.1 hypothetical protein ATNIH1004_011301 [Aspergillus tanneri]THC94514.1 hypothetical protein EYZ11_005996 [Aspergillus tanneri]